jgi:threonine dehydrogenase-like Zn-dependent dehydrogenase
MNGASARYLAVPEHVCVRVPDTVDISHAALAEPLSCALYAWDVLSAQVGRTVAIYGSGTLGLILLQVGPNVRRSRGRHCRHQPAQARGRPGTLGASNLVVDATGCARQRVGTPEVRVEIDPFDLYEREITIVGAVCPLNSFDRSVAPLANGSIDPVPLVSDTFNVYDVSMVCRSSSAETPAGSW